MRTSTAASPRVGALSTTRAEGVIFEVPAQGGGNYTGGTGDAAGANSDFIGPADYDTELRTPAISGFGPNVVLTYTANYQNFGNADFLNLDVSTDGGTNWTTVLRLERGPWRVLRRTG